MNRWRAVLGLALIVVTSTGAIAAWRAAATGQAMTEAANKFLETLDAKQRATVVLPYDTPKRVDWHFIPKSERKGLQVKHMKESQRKAALHLLRTTLSKVGYDKAIQVMELESVLKDLEKEKRGGAIRDSQRYYYTIFGEPKADSKWGLSIEGHHLSFNFVVDGNSVVSSTPTFYAANPATLMSDIAGVKKGVRVLKQEEALGFQLVNSLTDEQKTKVIISDKAPREIRGAGEQATPKDEKVGISYAALDDDQKRIMRELVRSYITNLPEDVGSERMQGIVDSGPANVHFAWAGPTKPGIGHYYRIQGPSFLIEFVNTQPDPAGNPANHIHCVWRDGKGDFAISQAN